MTNIYWHCFNVKLALFIAALLAVSGAGAQEAREQGPQIWLTSGFFSHHFKRDAGYNERNYGIGAELHFDDSNTIAAGIYRNSVRETTHYLHYVWTPLEFGPAHFGVAIGLIDGYPQLNNGRATLALMPVATTEFKLLSYDAGVNFVYIPTVARRVDGALALQFKIRVH